MFVVSDCNTPGTKARQIEHDFARRFRDLYCDPVDDVVSLHTSGYRSNVCRNTIESLRTDHRSIQPGPPH